MAAAASCCPTLQICFSCACASAYIILADQVGAGLLEFKTCSPWSNGDHFTFLLFEIMNFCPPHTCSLHLSVMMGMHGLTTVV